MIGFRCDYLEGCHPAILKALSASNEIQCDGYGQDEFSKVAADKIRTACVSPDSQVHFIVGGTPANKTVLAWLLKPWQGVLAAETGHIAGHETGAIEATGHKVMTLPHEGGKLSGAVIRDYCQSYRDSNTQEHEVEPGAVYLSQPTEFGTLYTFGEMQEIRGICDEFKLNLFVDGARLGYALASPKNDVTLPDLARMCEVFYIGGTKCGALCGEAVVVHPKMGGNFRHMMKQTSGILAKGRLYGLQFDTLFTDDLYLTICRNAVNLAIKIAKCFDAVEIPLYIDSKTNQQFPILTQKQMEYFAEEFSYEVWLKLDDERTVVRFCTSWATNRKDVQMLIDKIISLPEDLA